MNYRAPFPWFGSKSRIAAEVWKRLGDVPCYIEPFFGSGAVLLGRPHPFQGVETINDKDGLVCNFWRAVKNDPEAVAEHADYPALENDLHARHVWLVDHKDSLQAKLEGNPDFYDAKAAGWWVWGMACWIGSGFCSGKGPWKRKQVDGVWQLVNCSGADQGVERRRVQLSSTGQGVERKRVHLSNAGQGVSRQCVRLGKAGRGVKRQRVHLGDAGQGVSRQCVRLGKAGRGNPGTGECGLLAWMEALAERFSRVRVCCGDWRRICGGNSGNALEHFFHSGQSCGVFLDPPYSAAAERDENIYRQDSLTVAHDVREWVLEHGDDSRLRIALCGYESEHKMPSSWKCLEWKASSGYAQVGKNKNLNGKANRHRERIWFSPHCLEPAPLSAARYWWD
ncbi:MAG: DNA adenine methylase [Patescibacteria group bacterium]